MSLQPFSGLVDTHCHLDFDVFNKARDSIIERARLQGVIRIVNPGIDIPTSRMAIGCAELFPEVYAAVGIHPNSGSGWNKESLSDLTKLAESPKVVAVGEIGLDYFHDDTSRAVQRSIFHQQLELATNLFLPVIIHNRDASDDILKITREWHDYLITSGSPLATTPGVMHSFSGNIAFANELLELNFSIGIPGTVTFKNTRELQSVVRIIPIENLLVETDSPFLTPHPFRGKLNEPANVRIVAEKISELRSEPLEKVICITTAGADKLFKWRKIL